MTDKLVFVGKNYLEHAKELGDIVPEKPVLFLKPPSILKQAKRWGETLHLSLPQNRGEVHYECEIVLKLGEKGKIDSVSLGLDMTLRTLQTQLKKNGHPWTIGKVFPDSAVVGPEISLAKFPNYLSTPFSFSLNDEIKQQGQGLEMTLSPLELVSYIGQFFPLCTGDLIYTGTPVGVGAVKSNDRATLQWGDYQYSVLWS